MSSPPAAHPLRRALLPSQAAVLLVAMMFLGSLVLWVGVPVAWLWIGSRLQNGTSLSTATGEMMIGLLLSVTLLTILVAMGVNVLPIIGGLSIFGIAIGFGSQTLVKDVVSGLFFLIDDAFRLGEYIETPGAKGTVEKISVRSVSLRNARGATAVAPYSLRARPGATVATPLAWDELSVKVPPARVTLVTVPKRIARKIDPWADYEQRRQRITAAMQRALGA